MAEGKVIALTATSEKPASTYSGYAMLIVLLLAILVDAFAIYSLPQGPGGTLNIMPTPGFYQSGSTYNIILADQSITGSFTTINGATLPFISFVPVGIVTVGTQQAYQLMAVRSTTYANAIASVATPSQLAK